MKTRKLLPLIALIAVLLGGCRDTSSSANESQTSGTPTTSVTETSTGGSSNETSETIDGFYISQSWPNSHIAAFINLFDVSDALPAITLEREIIHGVIDLGYGDFYYLEVLTDDEGDLITISTPLEDAAFDVTLEDNYLYAVSPLQEIQLQAIFYPEDDEYEAGIEVMIFVADDFDSGLKEHDSWPTNEINSYLALMKSTSVIPSLPNVTLSYTEFIDDDPFFPDPYLFVFVPGANRTNEYKGILAAAGFDLELYDGEDAGDDDYYFAYKDAENLELEFGFYPEDDYFPAGLHIYITAYMALDGPGNEENALSLDFKTTAQQTVATDTEGVWVSGDLTMTITKGTSTVLVGGDKSKGGYWADPLRVYNGQDVNFALKGGKTIDQIVITVDVSGNSTVDALLEADFSSSVLINEKDLVVTIKPNGNISSLTLTPSGQVRFTSLVVYYN